jgi:sugar phosphate isomerase/epimerase
VKFVPLSQAIVLALLLVSPPPVARCAGNSPSSRPGGVFARDNLVAWCIVPFDAKHRGPKDRADMLVRLGIRRIAYDWRDPHIPEWDEELDQYKSHGIELVGFWAPDRHKQILDLLKRHGLKTQLWMMVPDPKEGTADQRVAAAVASVAPVAKLAKEYGCTVGLYNHGGWVGEPENQLAIIHQLEQDGIENVGIVYNLHHGHEHLSRFNVLMPLMKSRLMCLTINGMKQGGPMILPVGQGDDDLALLRIIRDSGYTGPISILNHREEVDAEQGLRENIEGLKKLLAAMHDDAALSTYRE